MDAEYLNRNSADEYGQEVRDWLDSLDAVIQAEGKDRCVQLLKVMEDHVQKRGVALPRKSFHTPYLNTIDLEDQPPILVT